MQDQLERLPVLPPIAAVPAPGKGGASFRLPEPLADLLSRLPSYPASWLFVQGLNPETDIIACLAFVADRDRCLTSMAGVR